MPLIPTDPDAINNGITSKFAMFPFIEPSAMFGYGMVRFLRNALYLVRPDGYVGLADQDEGATAIASYLDERKIAMATQLTERHFATTPR